MNAVVYFLFPLETFFYVVSIEPLKKWTEKQAGWLDGWMDRYLDERGERRERERMD